MASDAVRLLFITIIIIMIKACYYQQVSILSRSALQSHAIVSSEENDRADSYSSKSLHHHASSSTSYSLISSSAYAIINVAISRNH